MDLGELQRVFLEALDQPDSDREAWVREQCADAQDLEAEVLALLRQGADSDARTALRIAPTGVLAASFQELELPAREAGDRVLARYVVDGLIGQGGFSRVYRGRDEVTDEPVAIKLMRRPAGAEGARAETEVSLLRYLSLPGVVRVLDDGVDTDALCLVTDLIEGAPFPGADAPSTSELRSRVADLLRILARLHEAGVLHNDLKPANVLVSEEGSLTLIDLGVAHDLTGSGEEASMWGTPAYVAPERASGGTPTVQTDLFSVGAMVAEAAQAGDADLARLAAGCMRTNPTHRPTSCVAALELLGERTSASLPEGELSGILSGPERIHHVPSRAVALAERRAHSAGHSPHDEVRAWIDEGWASLEKDRVRISPRQLAQLRRRPPPGAYGHGVSPERAFRSYLASFAEGHERAALTSVADDELPSLAVQIASGTRMRAAADALEVLIATGRFAAGRLEAAEEDDLWTALVESALAQSTLAGLHRAAYALRQAESEHAAHLSRVLEGAVATLQGQAERAAECLAAIDEDASPGALRLTHAVRVLGAQSRSIEEHRAAVEGAARWAATVDQPGLSAVVASWQGWLLYREGKFEEAARMHEQAAAAPGGDKVAWRARLNAAAALLDAGLHSQAAAHAEACLRVGQQTHLGAVLEARAETIHRGALYRDDLIHEVDEDLVACLADGVHPHFAASIFLTEASIAWRTGDGPRSAALASRAAVLWAQIGRSVPAHLAWALVVAADPESRVPAVDSSVTAGAPPAILLQTLGLRSRAGHCSTVDVPMVRRKLAEWTTHGEDATRRREVCSAAEATCWLETGMRRT